jgi:D-glycero-D-manno-heptose 1,7-bisphosphate phosphatase
VALSMSERAVFLDKDGTLIEDIPYNVDPARIRFAPGAAEGLRLLHAAHYQLIVISNQSGVARGYFTEGMLLTVEARLRDMFSELGVRLTAFYYCPHHPDGVSPRYAIWCSCRKPAPGMLIQAALEHNIDLERSWFVGDILNDAEAGNRAGCRTVLIDNGNETEWLLTSQRTPLHIVADFKEATRVITSADEEQKHVGARGR